MNVEKYLKEDIEIRKKHVDLKEECLERGGNSSIHRGVLAQYLKGNIYGRPADLCHACHNPNCSNPKHLYWGTRSENVKDSISNGTHNAGWNSMVEKYGDENARNILSEKAKEHHKKLISNGYEHPHKNTVYINNGLESKRIQKDETIPEGWVRGRIKYKK